MLLSVPSSLSRVLLLLSPSYTWDLSSLNSHLPTAPSCPMIDRSDCKLREVWGTSAFSQAPVSSEKKDALQEDPCKVLSQVEPSKPLTPGGSRIGTDWALRVGAFLTGTGHMEQRTLEKEVLPQQGNQTSPLPAHGLTAVML